MLDNTHSVWIQRSLPKSFPALQQSLNVDIAIIGGGITGITAAYLLSQSGRSVAVLEAGSVGEGSTGFSTGNLYSVVGESMHQVLGKWDEKVLRKLTDSRSAAINLIERIIKEHNIDCNFRKVPWCLFCEKEDQRTTIQKEKEAVEKAGLSTTSEIPFPVAIDLGFAINDQAQFNPYKYTISLAKKIDATTCSIYEDTVVTKVDEENGVIEANGFTVSATYIIMATHTPKGVYAVQSFLGPYREYAVAVKLNGEYPPPGIFWNVDDGHHYSLRTYESEKGMVLMAVGKPHKVGQKRTNEECFDDLENFLRQRFDVASVEYKWAAQQYRAADKLPYIGKISGKSKVFIATGFAADGLTWGTLAAMIISDNIQGLDNPWAETFDAGRTSMIASAKEFVKENINVIGQYLKDLPGLEDVKEFIDIAKGEGRIIDHAGEKLAAYRDNGGELHVFSAVCTHMDCIVNYNEAETSWDCPCHGSRFSIDGEVIEGPAALPLKKITGKKT
jgi:glycine/D-amino acid oxidase-like deaminating enzyme/nitrite reductase/ring-hydroxylating ferredoxin subunit